MTNKIKPHSMSLWRHFFHREKTGEQLAAVMIEWQEKWGWDFIKVNPPASYHVLDWGARYEFFPDEFREPQLTRAAIQAPEDVDSLKAPDPAGGTYGEQLEVIGKLRRHFGPALPIVQTLFSPIEAAHRMMSARHALLRMRHNHPDRLRRLLDQITNVFRQYAIHCVEAGADGIFFATKWASSELLSWADYQEFGKKYEMPILDALKQRDALVVLHVCGERTYLGNMLDYPVDVFSYDFFAQGVPDPATVARSGKLALGGIDPDRLEQDLSGVVESCRQLARLPGWVAGPSCVVPPTVTGPTIARLKTELKTLLA